MLKFICRDVVHRVSTIACTASLRCYCTTSLRCYCTASLQLPAPRLYVVIAPRLYIDNAPRQAVGFQIFRIFAARKSARMVPVFIIFIQHYHQ